MLGPFNPFIPFYPLEQAPRYGLPDVVKICRRCVIPNTRPSSCNEYKHASGFCHEYIQFDDEGICSACRFAEAKNDGTIDWVAREKELLGLLDRYRSEDGSYDILVPGSGGKDSCYAAHLLKYKYGMHPLTVTWSPHLYTDIGWRNFQNWIHVGGFDNFLFTPNGRIHRLLTRNAFQNLLHPFQPFILGQKTFAVKMAVKFGIPLVFYGESPGEYGANVSINQKTFSDNGQQGFKLRYFEPGTWDEVFLGGVSVAEYLQQGVTLGDLKPFLPIEPKELGDRAIEFHYLGYYVRWHPQGAYYHAAEHCAFAAAPERTPGTYSKYNSLDDRTDDFFYYTTNIKFGYGRATQDAAQEVRSGDITRSEAVALVRRFDGEFPKRYFKDFLDYVGLTEEEFRTTCDRFRDPHLWKKEGGEWKKTFEVA